MYENVTSVADTNIVKMMNYICTYTFQRNVVLKLWYSAEMSMNYLNVS